MAQQAFGIAGLAVGGGTLAQLNVAAIYSSEDLGGMHRGFQQKLYVQDVSAEKPTQSQNIVFDFIVLVLIHTTGIMCNIRKLCQEQRYA